MLFLFLHPFEETGIAVAIALIGADGQLGRDLCPLLEPDVVRLTHADVELTDRASIERALRGHAPEAVVNLAAYNLVDRAEDEPHAAFAVNALGVRELALVCRQLGCRLVHVSTDYVFGMEAGRNTPYAEGDCPGPISTYGMSKLAGEYFVRSICLQHLVVRTCGLYGLAGSHGKGGNFVESMLRLAKERAEVRVVDDQVCTPSFTRDVAAALALLVRGRAEGLYHVTNDGQCTWHEFACTIFRLAGLPVRVQRISSQQLGAKARRPAYSVLSSAGCQNLGLSLRPWQNAVQEYLLARLEQGVVPG